MLEVRLIGSGTSEISHLPLTPQPGARNNEKAWHPQ